MIKEWQQFKKNWRLHNDGCSKFLERLPFRSRQWKSDEAGFTLIEVLVALAVFAIVLGVAVLAIPNHDKRYWQDDLDHLVGSLNMAQEESAMAGMPIIAQIDSMGWRFFAPGVNGALPTLGSGMGLGNAPTTAGRGLINSSGLMPDVYQPKAWHKPVEMAALQLTLGGEQVTSALQIPIKQDDRQASILRNRNGRFTWLSGAAP